eukprot:m.168318 g.168318  ORF g.168318 m.168318 type:complete len:1477 (+) comp38953_c1_seq7:237-4667(+)
MSKERTDSGGGITRLQAALYRQGEPLVERTVTVIRDDTGYGLTVSGDNPVFIQSVKDGGPAARAGVHPGDRILMVNDRNVAKAGHVEVVQLIKATKIVNLRLSSRSSLLFDGRQQKQPASQPAAASSPQAVKVQDNRKSSMSGSSLERMLKKERQYYKDRCEEYERNPNAKFHREMMESCERVQKLEQQLSHLSDGSPRVHHTLTKTLSAKAMPSKLASVGDEEVLEKKSFSRSGSGDLLVPIATTKKDTPIIKRKKAAEEKEKRSSRPLLPGFSKSSADLSKQRKKEKQRSPTPPKSSGGEKSVKKLRKEFEGTSSHQSSNSSLAAFICIDDSDEDEDISNDGIGPFSDLALLEKMPAHASVFLNYLISDEHCSPANMFFYLISGIYQKHPNVKDLKRMAGDVYNSFLSDHAPLKVEMDESITREIETALRSNINDELFRSLFNEARDYEFHCVSRQLAEFRGKRSLGLGSMFGEALLSDDLCQQNQVDVVSRLLMPHLQQLTQSPDSNGKHKRAALSSSILTFMQDVGVKVKLKFNAGGRPQSFTSPKPAAGGKPSSIFKNNKFHLIRGHEFVAVHYHYPTFCDHCQGMLWGFGFQGYRCQVCGFNVHKQSCNDVLPAPCQGQKKGSSVKIGSLWVDREKRKSAGFLKRKSTDTADTDSISSFRTDITNASHESEFNLETVSIASSESGRVTRLVETYEQNAVPSPAVSYDQYVRRARAGSMAASEKSATLPSSSGKDKKKEVTRTRSLKLSESEKIARQTSQRSLFDRSDSVMSLRDEDGFGFEEGRLVSSPSMNLEDQELMQDEDMVVEDSLVPWVETMDKQRLEKLSSTEIKRQELIHELLYTERSHVKRLKTIFYVFYTPLLNSKFLSRDKVTALFPCMRQLVDLYRCLMLAMKEKFEEGMRVKETRGQIACIGDLMLRRFQGYAGDELVDLSAGFVAKQSSTLEQIKLLRQKSKEFDRFIVRCESRPICGRLQLTELMSVVLTRLTKYPLLLEKILKYTEDDHPDYENTKDALEACKRVLTKVNDVVQASHTREVLSDIQKKLDTSGIEKLASQFEELKDFKLMDESNELYFHGQLGWKLTKNRLLTVYTLVFHHMLVLLERNEDKDRYQLKIRQDPNGKADRSPVISFRNLLIREVAYDPKAFFAVSTTTDTPRMYELVAQSLDERKLWETKIGEAITIFKSEQGLIDSVPEERHSEKEVEEQLGHSSEDVSDDGGEDKNDENALRGKILRESQKVTAALGRKAILFRRLRRLQFLPVANGGSQPLPWQKKSKRRHSTPTLSPLVTSRTSSLMDALHIADQLADLSDRLSNCEQTLGIEPLNPEVAGIVQNIVSGTSSLQEKLNCLLLNSNPHMPSLNEVSPVRPSSADSAVRPRSKAFYRKHGLRKRESQDSASRSFDSRTDSPSSDEPKQATSAPLMEEADDDGSAPSSPSPLAEEPREKEPLQADPNSQASSTVDERSDGDSNVT